MAWETVIFARGRAMVAYSDVVLAQKHWVGPDLYSLEVDWDTVRAETQNPRGAWQ